MFGQQLVNIPINTQYTYYFFVANGQNAPVTGINFMSGYCSISKNGASFINTTNLPVEVGLGWYVIILTASEMNYETIILSFIDPLNSTEGHSVWISTEPVGLAISTVLPNITSFTSFDNPTMQEVLSVMWQAMTLEASKKKWSFATFLQKWTF